MEVVMRVKTWCVLVCAVVAGVALGQMRVGDDGRAADANTRVGSGGYNTPRPNLQLASPNDVALGNVTGGREFRGSITRDPSQPFGGRSNLPTDVFFRRSNAQAGPGMPALATGQYAVPYYSSSPVGRPPGSFVLDPYTGQYIQPPKPQPGGADIQYGVPPGTAVIRPGAEGEQQLVLPAMGRDENGVPISMTLTATPLLGLRPMTALSDEDRFLLQRSLDPRRGDEVDAETIRKLRRELRDTLLVEPQLGAQLRDAELRAQSTEAARRSALSQGASVTNGTALDAPAAGAGLERGQLRNGAPLNATPGGGQGLGGAGGSLSPAIPEAGGIGARATDSSVSGALSGAGSSSGGLMAELHRIEKEREARRAAQMKLQKEGAGGVQGGVPGSGGVERGGVGAGGSGVETGGAGGVGTPAGGGGGHAGWGGYG
jgi:hypothetical protein